MRGKKLFLQTVVVEVHNTNFKLRVSVVLSGQTAQNIGQTMESIKLALSRYLTNPFPSLTVSPQGSKVQASWRMLVPFVQNYKQHFNFDLESFIPHYLIPFIPHDLKMQLL